MSESIDRIVADYFVAVERAAADLPPNRRAELLADLDEHIRAERAELEPETEAGVRDILERLGDPYAIAEEARQDAPPQLPLLGRPARQQRNKITVGLIVGITVAFVSLLTLCCLGIAVYRLTSPGDGPTSPASVDAPAPRGS